MVKRKKPGRKPSERIRQHVMLDPDNWEYLRESAYNDGRSLSDQANWLLRAARTQEDGMNQVGENPA